MEQTLDISLVINYLEISIVILCFVVGVIIKKYILTLVSIAIHP